MSSIQSSVGLISGINIEDTVNQLIAISARSRTNLQSRNVGIQQEQAAVGTLSATLLALQFTTNNLQTDAFDARSVTSSDESSATVTVQEDATPSKGSFSFTSLQTSSAQQLVSDPIIDPSSGIGTGDLSIRFGGHLGKGVELGTLNGGEGFDTGKIKLTDKSGNSAVIDLRAAQTVDDVIKTINSSTDIDVIASTDGDSFVLTDDSGGTGNLRVQEIGVGTTAASLGLTSLSVNGDVSTGADVQYLGSGTQLSTLNRGAGVSISDASEIDDLTITFVGESAVGVDLTGASTLGDVVDLINNDDDLTGKLTAAISSDGSRLELTAIGNDIEEITSSGTTAEDLGIATTTTTTTLSGNRLIGGLQDTLLADLNGGNGFDLGTITISDSDGGTADIDLSSAETLEEILSLINDEAGVDVTASINDNGDGIQIEDNTSGGNTFEIADFADGKTTATNLGLVDGTSGSLSDSGSLNLATIQENTKLDTLNGGSGIDVSDIYITDSNGNRRLVNLDSSTDAESIGDVIDMINGLDGLDVVASLNATGDGLLLTDTGDGDGTLKVEEDGNGGTTAADLRILGNSSETDGSDQQIIDGTTSFSIDLSDLNGAGSETELATLNGGDGIDLGTIYIRPASIDPTDDAEAIENGDARGGFTVTLNDASTLQDVIDEINSAATAAGFDVTAELNGDGTGLEITDSTAGNFQLAISDLGSNTTASDLKIAGTAPNTINDTQTLSGAGLIDTGDAELGALGDLVERINELSAGVTASVFQDASGYRLSITADEPGSANELLIGSSLGGLSFTEVSEARDAAIAYGSATDGSGGISIFSESNTFNDVISGVDLTITKASTDPITVEVSEDSSQVVNSVQSFVDAYNSVRTNLDRATSFDEETFQTGVLFGTTVALQVDTDLARIASGSFSVGGSFTSLGSIGIDVNSDGTLSLNQSELQEAFNDNPNDLEQLFLDETFGIAARFDSAISRLAGEDNSLLDRRTDSLTQKVTDNNSTIESMTARLEVERESMLLEFYLLEQTIAQLQANQTAIGDIQPITIANSRNN